jgi:DNA repair exonuclease SbcCD nuclease subunit
MFDTFSNSEHVLAEAVSIISRTSLVLSGNHDVVNQADKIGSLQMLDRTYQRLLGSGHCLFAEFGKPMAFSWPILAEDVHVVAVPHVATQTLFEESLNQAMEVEIDRRLVGGSILLLHCNYDMSEDWVTETTLNLKSDRAKALLEKFDYIMLGHEHEPAEYLGGRLIILGNLFPTCLGDISDKRIAVMENGKLRFEPVWSKASGYAEYAHDQIPDTTGASFIRVKGEVEPGDMLEMTQAISRLWKKSPYLYCVKVDARIKGLTANVDGQSVNRSIAQLPELIRRELEQHPAMLELWDTLKQQEEESHESRA